MTDRRDLQTFHPFARLNRLLDGVPPGRPGFDRPDAAADAPILLSVGEPQNQPPAFVAEELARAAAGWSRYPPPRGTAAYAETCVAWLAKRYGTAAGLVDAQTMCLPLAGTREGLFFAALATTPAHGKTPPAILMPNPFYHVYAGAAAAAGAEAICVPATPENGFLPDYAALPAEILARTTLCYFCSPANPQGVVASLAQLQDLIALARRYDFTIAFDECYAEIYTEAPPPGALQAAAGLSGGLGAGLENMLIFHSLSKRSSAPGLRCGFVVGDRRRLLALEGLLRVGSAGVPLPVLAAGTRLWQEEDHVQANRARYQANFAVAERVLGNRFGFRKPAGGFFLWLDVGDGEAVAGTLWREAGIKVLPGAYMCAEDGAGGNPGAPYVRIALVYDAALTEAALARLGEIL